MNKTISTALGVLVIILVAGVAGASVLFFSQDVEEEVAPEEETFVKEDEKSIEDYSEPEEDEKTETDSESEFEPDPKEKAETTLIDFLNYAFKEESYKKAANLYYTESDLSDEKVAESLEWNVSSFGLGREERTYTETSGEEVTIPATPSVDRIEIKDKEKISEKHFDFLVQIILTDGSLLSVGICCEPGTFDSIISDIHRFPVQKIEEEWRVTRMIYQP